MFQIKTIEEKQHLTPRHHMVIRELVSGGKSNREIAAALGITEHTVKGYISAILKSLNVQSRTQLVAMFTPIFKPPANKGEN